MNKHTEGTWLILPEEPNIPYIRVRGSQLGRRYKIANVHADRESDLPETRANAHLIAAAPQMLEALEAAYEHICPDGDPLDAREFEVCGKIEAAIAAAKGEV